MDLHLADKVVVVTGAASGIGRATANAFSTEGSKVILADITRIMAVERSLSTPIWG